MEGTNWFSQSDSSESYLNSIDMISSLTGYAVGKNGLILKTANDGDNWISQHSGSLQDYDWFSLLIPICYKYKQPESIVPFDSNFKMFFAINEYYLIIPSESAKSKHFVVLDVSNLKLTTNYYSTTLYLTV